MGSELNTLGLFAATAVLLLLPLLPAMIEYRGKTDAQPLRVVQDYAGEIRHFSHSFRDFVQGLQAPLRECALQGSTGSGSLRDGSEYILLGHGALYFFQPEELEQHLCNRVILCAGSFSTPDQMAFAKEMQINGDLQGGIANVFRALLVERDAKLAAGSTVLRWMHALGSIRAGRNCAFHGRLSSDKLIHLEPGCKFERMNAPRIEFGLCQREPSGSPAAVESQLDVPLHRLLLHEDLEVPAGKVIEGSVVSRGEIRIGAGARIKGSVKSNRDLITAEGVHIEGTAISAGKMRIGGGAVVHGPILAEHGLSIGSGTRCGSEQQPTTISAPEIHIEYGVLAFGTVWAKEQGVVES